MATAKFTPGPWHVGDKGHVLHSKNLLVVHGAEIHANPYTDGYLEEIRANANLIAAAPEMYELLIEMEDTGYIDRTKLRKILDKADGRQA